VTLSPVYPTQSKPGYGPALAPAAAAELAGRVPWLALGGVDTAERAAACAVAGAQGIAVMGAIMRAPDPERVARELAAGFGAARAARRRAEPAADMLTAAINVDELAVNIDAVNISTTPNQHDAPSDVDAGRALARPHDARPHDARPHDARPHDARPRDARLHGAPLDDARLGGARLHGAPLDDARLGGARLHGAPLDDARPDDARLHDARNQHVAPLRDARQHDVPLHDARLTGAVVAAGAVGSARPIGSARPAGTVRPANPPEGRWPGGTVGPR